MKALTYKEQHYQVAEKPYDNVFVLKQSNKSIVAGDLPETIYATLLSPLSQTDFLIRIGDSWVIPCSKLTTVEGERQALESYKNQKKVLILKNTYTEYTFELAELSTPTLLNEPAENLVPLGYANPSMLIGLPESRVVDLVKQIDFTHTETIQPPTSYLGEFKNGILVDVFAIYEIPKLKASIVANQIIIRSAPKYAEALVLYSHGSTVKKSMQETVYLSQGIFALAYQYKGLVSEPTKLGYYSANKHFIPNFDGLYQHGNGSLMPFTKNTPLDLTTPSFTLYSQGIIQYDA